MESLLLDVKRATHLLIVTMQGLFGALGHASASPKGKVRGYRAIADTPAKRDIYGRIRKVDIYESRDMVKFYREMSRGNDKPI